MMMIIQSRATSKVYYRDSYEILPQTISILKGTFLGIA
jgi:hypothetical protein